MHLIIFTKYFAFFVYFLIKNNYIQVLFVVLCFLLFGFFTITFSIDVNYTSFCYAYFLFAVVLSQLFKNLPLPSEFPVTIRFIQYANSIGYHFEPTNPVSFITRRPSRIYGLSGKINPEIAGYPIHMFILPFVYYFFICFIQYRDGIKYILFPLLSFHHSLEWNDRFC